MFCIECNRDALDSIELRLRNKKIICQTGTIGSEFLIEDFFKEPMISYAKKGKIERQFDVRLTRNTNDSIICASQVDDLFVIARSSHYFDDMEDIEVEHLDITSFKELKYLLGLRKNYE